MPVRQQLKDIVRPIHILDTSQPHSGHLPRFQHSRETPSLHILDTRSAYSGHPCARCAFVICEYWDVCEYWDRHAAISDTCSAYFGHLSTFPETLAPICPIRPILPRHPDHGQHGLYGQHGLHRKAAAFLARIRGTRKRDTLCFRPCGLPASGGPALHGGQLSAIRIYSIPQL